MTVPTLMLMGTDTAPALTKTTLQAIAAIPHTQTRVLGGHAHLAFLTEPAMVADIVTRFIDE